MAARLITLCLRQTRRGSDRHIMTRRFELEPNQFAQQIVIVCDQDMRHLTFSSVFADPLSISHM